MGITLASHLEQTLPLQKLKIKRMVKNSIKPVGPGLSRVKLFLSKVSSKLSLKCTEYCLLFTFFYQLFMPTSF